MPPHSPYQEFLSSLRGAMPPLSEPFPPFIVLFGSCGFLLQKATQAICAHWEGRFEAQPSYLEEGHLTAEYLRQVWGGSPMFASSALHVVRRIKKQKDLGPLLKPHTPSALAASQASLLLSIEADSLLASMQKDIKRLQGALVICDEPAKGDLSTFLGHLAQKQGITLAPSALEVLLEVGAQDFYKIENEIQKLALIFAGQREALHKKDISIHLGILKEEHAFALTRYLLARKHNEAAILVEDLVERGESPLAILGLLAKHYRTALKVKEANSQLQSSLKLPGFLLRPYQEYCRAHTLKTLATALSRCQEADIELKTNHALPPQAILQSVLS